MPKVLVVEDEFLIMMWVEDALRDAGYSVVTASNADEAIDILEGDTEVRIVFTDIDMPGSMDGLRLAAVVRDRWPPVYIIVASGKHRPVAGEMPSEAVFLPKPYLSVDILTALNVAARR
ncbi:response regulator [Tardiphaga alba]|uniref:Response regulator n=1 Tax=Tardiphaga alba TaxID=340268 RepID=A0ABX8AE63_9BRAD|nr:response regulator [Tardiphaga alba]QUS40675.1 response regulator [Tardiphaga alba]